MCALYMDTGRKLLHLARAGRSGRWADLDLTGGGGMGASEGREVTHPSTDTSLLHPTTLKNLKKIKKGGIMNKR